MERVPSTSEIRGGNGGSPAPYSSNYVRKKRIVPSILSQYHMALRCPQGRTSLTALGCQGYPAALAALRLYRSHSIVILMR